MSKPCYICDTVKDESEFYSNAANKDGLHTRCKDCEKRRKNNAYANDPQFRQRAINYSSWYRLTWYTKMGAEE